MNRETENKNNGECEKIDTGAMACVVGHYHILRL